MFFGIFWLFVEIATVLLFWDQWHNSTFFRVGMGFAILVQLYAIISIYRHNRRTNQLLSSLLEDASDAMADSLRQADDNTPYARYMGPSKRKLPKRGK